MHECVAIIDSGGRGTVLAESYLKSPHTEKLIVIPGNDWIKYKLGPKEVKTFPVNLTDIEKILQICSKEHVNLIDVAQDNVIAAGLVDAATDREFVTLGPCKNAGRIEWDKAYSRRLLSKLGIPQPSFEVFNTQQGGIDYILSQPNQNYFIKASGLCAGKGALPAKNKDQAVEAILKMKAFGEAGKTYLIEEWLKSDGDIPGEEFSAFVITDGKDFKLLGTAKDFKRAYNFNEGENTGGMGSISPHPTLNKKLLGEIENIFEKTLEGLKKAHRPYIGILYMGGMVVEKGGKQIPYVIEFNARWGDPEAQSIVPGIKNDLYELSLAATGGDLKNIKIETDDLTRVVVAGVTRGYPGSCSIYTNQEIHGIDQVVKSGNVRFYGGGLKIIDCHYFTPLKPSRLFYVVGEGENVLDARTKAYGALRKVRISEDGLYYRTDIG